MEQKHWLYKNFGKFMGKPVQHNDETFHAINQKAEELNLTTRFMSTAHSQDDFGDKERRLNIVMEPRTLAIQQIALG